MYFQNIGIRIYTHYYFYRIFRHLETTITIRLQKVKFLRKELPMKTKYEKHGALYFNRSGKLVDCNNKIVQLCGYSTHGLSWYPQYVNRDFFEFMRDNWHIDVVRLAMYTAEKDGYCVGDSQNQSTLISLIDKGVKAATELGLYVIIDWHILSDSNPLMHIEEASAFFRKMAERYHAYGNVIYEICNEPNVDCTWKDIKEYANTIIPIIREYDEYSIILVGTPTWSQDVNEACDDPIKGFSNIGYVLHFYADTHRDELRKKLSDAADAKLPLFVSEFGICDACGNGALNEEQGNLWLDLLDEHQISYCMWNLSNCNESSASFIPSCEKTTNFAEEDLNPSAKWYIQELSKRNIEKKD